MVVGGLQDFAKSSLEQGSPLLDTVGETWHPAEPVKDSWDPQNLSTVNKNFWSDVTDR